MVSAEQVKACLEQIARADYMNVHLDAARRLAAGQRQAWCLDCQRWQWKDQACAGASLVDQRPEDQPGSPK